MKYPPDSAAAEHMATESASLPPVYISSFRAIGLAIVSVVGVGVVWGLLNYFLFLSYAFCLGMVGIVLAAMVPLAVLSTYRGASNWLLLGLAIPMVLLSIATLLAGDLVYLILTGVFESGLALNKAIIASARYLFDFQLVPPDLWYREVLLGTIGGAIGYSAAVKRL